MSDLVRWDPLRDLEDMSARFNRLIGRREGNGGDSNNLTMASWAPVVDIEETNEEFVIKAELPAFKKEEVKIAVKDGILSMRGERKMEKEEKGKKFHRVERSYGTFLRSFTIPEGVDEAKISAGYKDGMLDVHLPKSPSAKPRSVEVKVQ